MITIALGVCLGIFLAIAIPVLFVSWVNATTMRLTPEEWNRYLSDPDRRDPRPPGSRPKWKP